MLALPSFGHGKDSLSIDNQLNCHLNSSACSSADALMMKCVAVNLKLVSDGIFTCFRKQPLVTPIAKESLSGECLACHCGGTGQFIQPPKAFANNHSQSPNPRAQK